MFQTIILTILLFLIPVLTIAWKNRLFFDFTFKKVVRILNKSLIIQVSIGLLLFLCAYFLDRNYRNDIVYETIIETSYYYIVIGIFYYFPPLIILNLITKSWKKV